MPIPSRYLPIGPIACAFLGFAALTSLVRQAPQGRRELAPLTQGYRVTARFDNVGDLKVGAPLTIAGVNIGAVDQIRYDAAAAKAVVTLRVNSSKMQVPVDSAASIHSVSPVGGKRVVIVPGGSSEYLTEGGEILQTKSVLLLETLIQKSVKAATEHAAQPK